MLLVFIIALALINKAISQSCNDTCPIVGDCRLSTSPPIICNGISECVLSKFDESGFFCGCEAGLSAYLCGNNASPCLNDQQICDDERDCFNGRDESVCGHSSADHDILFPFGIIRNDTRVLFADVVSEQVEIDTPIVLFQREEFTFYVSSNGLISFRNSYDSSSPRPFDRDFFDFADPIIAPLWANFYKASHSGSVFYRTKDEATLSRVQKMIASASTNYSSFQPTLAVVVTWNSLLPIFENPNNDNFGSTYTFQAVIATDGEASFAIFIYDNVDFNRLRDPRIGLPTSHSDYQIGFNAGDRIAMFNILASSTEAVNIYRIDGLCITKLGLHKEVCPLQSYAIRCDEEEMVPLKCNCDFRVESPLCLSMFPFGRLTNDSFIDRSVGNVEGPVNLTTPLRFYRNLETRFFVASNGLISFKNAFNEFRVTQFPRISECSVPLIAPLWADYNFRQGGNIYFRVTDDNDTLSKAADLIAQRSLSMLNKFTPTSSAVVTWVETTLFRNSETKFTFQAVLSTDGNSTYAIFLYENPSAVRNIASQERIIGFEAGDQTRSDTVLFGTKKLNSFNDTNVFRIDGHCVTTAENACELGLVSMECGADFTAESCLCGENTLNETTCRLSHFFTFGTESDREGPREIDDSLLITDITRNFIFFNEQYTDLYVSTNGFITFGESYSLTVRNLDNVPFPIVAPLWYEYNFREEGTIYYRVARDNDTLRAIAGRIARSNSNYTNFKPIEAVIVTWFQSRVFQSEAESDDEIIVNFQAVLVTDDKISFAIFLYDNKDLGDSINTIFEETPFIVGFGPANQNRRVYQSETSDLERIFRIDGECIDELNRDGCSLNSVPLECGSEPLCLCNEGYKPMDNSCIDLIFFGSRAGDKKLETLYHMRTEAIEIANLPVPIIFYGVNQTNISIHAEGLLSFGNFQSALSSDNGFNLSMSIPPVIAPIADFELIVQDNGPTGLVLNRIQTVLYYRVITTDDNNNETLSDIDLAIKKFNENIQFTSTLAVIITWQIDISFFLIRSQTVLASNGKESYAILRFDTPPIDVFSVPDQLVGFSPGIRDTTKYSASLQDFTRNIEIFRIDGNCITSAANGSVCGANAVAVECEGLDAVNDGCFCYPGYEPHPNDAFSCKNIDECKNKTACEHWCEDFDGGYNCSCWKGYTLSSDGRTCQDNDECYNVTCGQNEYCEPQNGTHACNCLFETNNGTCEDMEASTTSATTELTLSVTLGVMLGVLAVLALVLITLLVVYQSYRKKKRRNQKFALANFGGREIQTGNNDLLRYKVQNTSGMTFPSSLIIPSCNLKLGNTLGQGEFGVVYKGYIKKAGVSENFNNTVAVKTLKGFVQKDLVDDLLKECGRMLSFDHPNVLKLVGVCLDGGPAPYIIMPFMANGSLSAYLKKERENLFLDTDSAKLNDATTVEKRLLDMCLQIAKGMEYLASKRVIHRDLAARNCMMDMNLLIKVADFGLAESLDSSKEYFRQGMDNAIKLPIKWMAPESIHDCVFSEKSDVWSYGVTCWEVFSAGKTPYPGIHPTDLPQHLDKGLRLEKPLNASCTDEIYSMILRCWDSDTKTRPCFSELVNHFMSNLVTKGDYLDFSVSNPGYKDQAVQNEYVELQASI